MINFKMISFLFAWLFPTKEDRHTFRDLCKKIEKRKKIPKIYRNYQNKIKSLKHKYDNNKKINIVFLSTTLSKWSYKYIYNHFKKNEKFNVTVLISVYDFYAKGKYPNINYQKIAEDNYNYFKKNGYNVEYAFDFIANKHIDLKKFSPDIIFYEQPWDIPKIYQPEVTSKYAITFYSSYGSQITNGSNEYSEELYKTVFQYYVDNPFIKKYLVDSHNFSAEHLTVSGQPKLDAYLEPIDTSNQIWEGNYKKRIIWAPHHSFFKNSILKFGTFHWNYKFIYKYAKEHPEYEFVFKPHPELKRIIVKEKLMTQEEVDSYWNSWDNLVNAKVYEKGDYFDLFRTSDLLITDCNSFLYEYLPTEKPVIHCLNMYSVGHNEFGQKLIKGYYDANNIEELEEHLENILIKEQDTLLSKRKYIINNILVQPKMGVAKFIYEDIISTITNRKKELEINEKNIFTFWEPKTNMPDYIKLCIKTWQKFLPEYKIHIIDYDNIDYYLGKNFFDKILYKHFSLPKQADAIRCALLEKYGGIWLDADTIITNKKVKDFFKIDSDFICIGEHIAFIIAKKNSYVLRQWLFNIKLKLLIYKMFIKIPFLKKIFKDILKNLENWDVLGNSILNTYFRSKNKNIYSIDRQKIKCMPELIYYPNYKEIGHYSAYNKFYFDSCEEEFNINETTLLLLHNSWTPKSYKDKSIDEILQCNNTISKILKEILCLEE